MEALRTLTPSTEITGLFALTVALLALYWLVRLGREARLRFVPVVAWWAVPGLALLLCAPVLDVPAMFGVGAGLLLLAEFWPGAYRRGGRPGVGWPLVFLTLGLSLLWSGSLSALGPSGAVGQAPLLLILALSLVLFGLGGLLAAAAYPRQARPAADSPAALGFQTRWNRVVTPEWPDLSVTLTAQGAQLSNVSKQPLRLAGWSPSGVNAWFRVRDEQGQVLNELRVGQSALLPVSELDSGVRVWYVQKGAPEQAQLFRADWTPTARASQRILN